MTGAQPIAGTGGTSSTGPDAPIRIGCWAFTPELHQLRANDLRVHLEPQVAKLLVFLVQNAGSLVAKQQILDHVWEGKYLSDSALTRSMTELRKALGDDARNPSFIQTVPKSGYRLIAPISRPPESPAPEPPSAAPWRRRPRFAAAMALLSLSALSAAGFVASRSLNESRDGWQAAPVNASLATTPWISDLNDATVIAVLPLENLSEDSRRDYFADGMTEALIAELTRYSAIDVISRHSVDRLLVDERPLVDVARLIGVDAVVEGSVVRQQDRVRINVQLTEIDRQSYSWAGSYERSISDVLSLQNEVSQAISQEVRRALLPETLAESAARAVDPAAYELYLQARQQLYRARHDGPNRAGELFRKVLKIDPGYSPAQVGLAEYYSRLAIAGHLSPEEAGPIVERAAQRALELDPNLPQAHVVLATMETSFGWDWTAAENHFLKAIELNPGHAGTRHPYSSFLAMMGRFDEALVQARKAAKLDPLSEESYFSLAHILFHAGRHDEVEAVVAQASKLSGKPRNHSYLLWSHAAAGRFDKALPGLRRALESGRGREKINAAVLGWALAGAGEMAEAEKIRRQMETSAVGTEPYAMAILYTGLGEIDLAFEALERAVAQRSPDAPYLKLEPFLIPLRSDPRFAELVAYIGL